MQDTPAVTGGVSRSFERTVTTCPTRTRPPASALPSSSLRQSVSATDRPAIGQSLIHSGRAWTSCPLLRLEQSDNDSPVLKKIVVEALSEIAPGGPAALLCVPDRARCGSALARAGVPPRPLPPHPLGAARVTAAPARRGRLGAGHGPAAAAATPRRAAGGCPWLPRAAPAGRCSPRCRACAAARR